MRNHWILCFPALFLISVMLEAQTPAPAKPVPVIFETELGKIEHVSQVQTLMVRRSSR